MSPLYHAIFLADGDAPRMIRDAHDDDKSNCGPNGQNVLHVAALRSKGKSTSLLGTHSKNCLILLYFLENDLHTTIYVQVNYNCT
jgi:hypothetical protein